MQCVCCVPQDSPAPGGEGGDVVNHNHNPYIIHRIHIFLGAVCGGLGSDLRNIWILWIIYGFIYDVYNIEIDPDDGSIELQEYVNAPAFVLWVGEGGGGALQLDHVWPVDNTKWVLCC